MTLKRWFSLFFILCAPFLVVLDVFILNVAIPSIQREFHATSAAVQLVVVGYIFSYASLLVTGGRLGDLYGHRKLFVAGISLFCLTSLLCAASPTAATLIAARVLQGIAAALMYPQALSLIQLQFHGKDRALALSAFGVTLGLAAILGQLFGGLLIHVDVAGLSWRSIFLVNIPLCLIVAVFAARFIAESRADGRPRLDLGGVALLTIVLLCLVSFLIIGRQLGWPLSMWPLLMISVAVGAAFVWYERKVSASGTLPLIQLDLLRIRPFLVGLIITLAFYAGQGSFILFLALFLQHGLQLPALAAGVAFTPIAIGLLLASLASAKVVARLGRRALTLGAAIAALATMYLSFPSLHYGMRITEPSLSVTLLALGIGFGLIIPSLIGTVLRGVPAVHCGSASGMLVTTQQVAAALGIAVLGIPFFGALSGLHPDYAVAFGHTLYFTAGLFAATALLTLFLKE